MANIYNSQLDAFDLYHKLQESSGHTYSSSSLGGPVLPSLGHAFAGSIGAAISNVTTYPLALIVARLQIQRQARSTKSKEPDRYDSFLDAALKIYSQDGVDGLFTGVTSDTAKTIADSFLFFLAYTFLRQARQRSHQNSRSKHLPVADELGVGFLAGAFSKVLTTPIANIVTRKQTNSMTKTRKYVHETEDDSLRAIAQQIHREKGPLGFWSGYSASLVLTLNPTLTFFFFETLKRIILSRDRRSSPTPKATFLLAALSKAMASAITYPFSLAKSRLQARGASSKDETEARHTDSRVQQRQRIHVFSILLQIARHEGVEALYEGLSGELLKGFLSHGTTMIVKDAVHKVVIQLYYVLMKMLRRRSSSQLIAQQSLKHAEHAANEVKDQARLAAEAASAGLHTLSQKLVAGDSG